MNIVRNISTWIVTLVLLISATTLSAQRASSLRISEVMTKNENSIVDEYAQHSPWIEIYNSSSSTVDLKGCYLTNNPNNLKLHRIPMWSTNTKIAPRQYIVLWADGYANKGVFHLGFKLEPSNSNFLALVDADGKSIISKISIPIIPANHSYKASNLTESLEKGVDIQWILSSSPSPLEPNEEILASSKVENLEKMDPSGIIMTTTAVAVVFIALLTLAVVFTLIGKTMVSSSRKKRLIREKKDTSHNKDIEVAIAFALSQHLSSNSEHIVAISLALQQAKEIIHDSQNMKLTIKRRNTQWNDKVYNMRRYEY